MIRYIRAEELPLYPRLSDSMFRDRAAQFRDRLGWPLKVDRDGHEQDEYDALNPWYAILEGPDGLHRGSMRFLPTSGRTMLAEHFAHLCDRPIAAPDIWECTRFCLAPGARAGAGARLMLAAAQFGSGMGMAQIAGVFDWRMLGVYRRMGWSPRVCGRDGAGRDAIGAGLWQVSDSVTRGLSRAAGMAPELSALWFHRAAAPARAA